MITRLFAYIPGHGTILAWIIRRLLRLQETGSCGCAKATLDCHGWATSSTVKP